jgi:hypothetical protein
MPQLLELGLKYGLQFSTMWESGTRSAAFPCLCPSPRRVVSQLFGTHLVRGWAILGKPSLTGSGKVCPSSAV